MNSKITKTIKDLEDIGFEITTQKDVKETFVDYFSNMDIDGLDSLLSEKHKYDGDTKKSYLNLINKEFEKFKSNNIHYLKPIVGYCGGCKFDCSGFTFVDETNGFYINMVISANNSEIYDLQGCYEFFTDEAIMNKKEQNLIKPFLKSEV